MIVNNTLPPAINALLRALFQKGPHTQGIFRRCASARALRELRVKVDTQGLFAFYFVKCFFIFYNCLGPAICEEITNTPPLLLAALLKEFLRSLPEPLLSGSVQEWLNAANSGRLEQLRRLLGQLPRENHLLLAHVICVLYHIAKRSTHNLMSAANLGKHIRFELYEVFCD